MKHLYILPLAIFILVAAFANGAFANRTTYTASGDCPVSWVKVDTPHSGSNLLAVKAISAIDIWAAGEGDMIHWNGNAWDSVDNPFGGVISRISASSSEDVWVVRRYLDDKYSILTSLLHWDGSKWSEVFNDTMFKIEDVAAIAPDDVWIVGDGTRHWDGEQWSAISLNSAESVRLGGITATSPNQVWAVGSTIGVTAWDSHARIFYWDGTGWSQVLAENGLKSGYGVASSSDANNVWSLGSAMSGLTAIHWDGKQWLHHDPPITVAYDFAVVAPDNVYLVGSQILHWDGESWGIFLQPQYWLKGVSALSPTEIWAVGDAGTVWHGTLPCAEPLPNTPTPLPFTPEPTEEVTPEACTGAPKPTFPKNNAHVDRRTVELAWKQQTCASKYQIVLRQDTQKGKKVLKTNVTSHQLTTPQLKPGHTYYWRVRGCDATKCGKWTKWQMFHINP